MSDITVLGIFVADISFSGDKIPTTGETILGDNYNIGPGGKGCNQAIAISRLGERVINSKKTILILQILLFLKNTKQVLQVFMSIEIQEKMPLQL